MTGNRELLEGVPFTIYPQRSLDARGQMLALGLSGAGLAAIGIGFSAIGAWPVGACAGLAEMGLCTAFALCARKAGQAQRLTLAGRDLHVDTRSAYLRSVQRVTLAAGWTRTEKHTVLVTATTHPYMPYYDEPIEICRISLFDGKRRIFIGDFLSPGERPALRAVIDAGLARHNGPRNSPG